MRRKHDGVLKTREMTSDPQIYLFKKLYQFRMSPSVHGVQGSLPYGHVILGLCPGRYPHAFAHRGSYCSPLPPLVRQALCSPGTSVRGGNLSDR
jgi:hypothetical protein